MKKFISTACAFTFFGFAIALANADTSVTGETASNSDPLTTDTTAADTTRMDSSNDMSGQSAGVAGSDNKDDSVTTSNTVTRTDTTQWKNSKTCTDASGVTYYKGKKGYDACVASLKKSQEKEEQMSGSVANDPTSTTDNSVKQDAGISSNPGWSTSTNDYSKPDSMTNDATRSEDASGTTSSTPNQ